MLSRGTKINDTSAVHVLFTATIQIWMNTDPHYGVKKCSPGTVVSGNIKLQIFVDISGDGHQTTVECFNPTTHGRCMHISVA